MADNSSSFKEAILAVLMEVWIQVSNLLKLLDNAFFLQLQVS